LDVDRVNVVRHRFGLPEIAVLLLSADDLLPDK
jgi:hypothetical protein